MAEPVRIVLAEERSVVLESLRRLLEGQAGFTVVGVTSRVADAARLAAKSHPDLLLMSVATSGEAILAALREVQAAAPEARVLLMGQPTAPVTDVLLAGARGVLPSEASPDELFKAIHTVVAGQCWVGRRVLDDVVHLLRRKETNGSARARDADGLTPRERQVVAGVARGESNREIASRLGLSEGTIKDYLTAIFDRLGLANRAELSAWATRRGLGDEPDQ